MSHVVDLTGTDFGYLHVIGRDTSKKGDTAHWICRCKCGTICSKDGRYLRNGHAKSCGCFRKERAATLATKKNPAKKPKAEPKKKKFGRGPQWAGSGICYNPLCPDAQQLPRRLELHRMPLLPGTKIHPPVEAGDHHNLKGVSKWQGSWICFRSNWMSL